MTFYGDRMKICEDFTPNFGNKGNGYCITTMQFSPENSKQNNMTVVFHPPCLPDLDSHDFSVSPIEDKTERL
jgi:hypothetical protein